MPDTREAQRSGSPFCRSEGHDMSETLLTALLAKAKLTLRITTDAFDPEISDIIEAGYYDLTTRGVIIEETEGTISPLVLRAIMTYVRLNFGEPENPERLRESYAEQRGQLMSTNGYTNWGEE